MGKATDHATSAGAYDGGIPVIQQVGLTAWSTGAVDDLGGFVAPCDLTLVQLDVRVVTLASGAAAKLNLGVQGDADANVDAFTIYNLAAGHYQVAMSDATVVSRTVSAGDYVKFQLEAATAVGDLAISAVWMPTSGQ